MLPCRSLPINHDCCADGRLGESHRAAAARVATPRLARPRPTRGSQSIAWPRASGCQPHSLSPVCQGGKGIAGGQQVATLVKQPGSVGQTRVLFRFQVKVAVKCAVSCRVTAPVAGQRISVRSSGVQGEFGGQLVHHPYPSHRAGDVGRSIGILGSCNKGNKGPKQQRPQHRHHRRHHHQHSGETKATPRGTFRLLDAYCTGPAQRPLSHGSPITNTSCHAHAMPMRSSHVMDILDAYWKAAGPRTWDNLHRINRGRNRACLPPCCMAAATLRSPPPLSRITTACVMRVQGRAEAEFSTLSHRPFTL